MEPRIGVEQIVTDLERNETLQMALESQLFAEVVQITIMLVGTTTFRSRW
jgi:hypothetical protein